MPGRPEPVLEARAREHSVELLDADHGLIATIETKLK
jgi:hypothetical protein